MCKSKIFWKKIISVQSWQYKEMFNLSWDCIVTEMMIITEYASGP